MLKLKAGTGFRINRGAKIAGSQRPAGVPILELQTAPDIAVEFEIKLYDDKGLLAHLGRDGPSKHWARGDVGFHILPDVDQRKRSP